MFNAQFSIINYVSPIELLKYKSAMQEVMIRITEAGNQKLETRNRKLA